MNDQDIRDLIRKRIEPKINRPLQTVAKDNWDKDFIEFMHGRMIVGAYRYGGTLKEKRYPSCYGANKAIERIVEYKKTGNVEGLFDAANFLMVEFACGQHPKKHFKTINERKNR